MWSRGVLLAVLVVGAAQGLWRPPVVRLGNEGGRVRGKLLKSAKGRDFAAFYSIPYGLPPVGPRRYKDPEAAAPPARGEVLDCTAFKPVCLSWERHIQNHLVGDEDCLRLSVFTPKYNTPTLDVLVVIHGGGFMFNGGGRTGVEYLMDLDMVVVQVDYRLGVLGFLSTGDEALPGNLGMRDQVLALEWIRDNIHTFGGNKHSVTLFGYSAGSASMLMHTLSPLSRGLFHRGIGQSGSPLNPWSQQRASLLKAKRLASLMNCPTTDTWKIVECLRTRNASDIVSTTPMFQDDFYEVPFSPLAPVVDCAHSQPFLPDHPLELLRAGKAMQVPLLLSHVPKEGLYTASEFVTNETAMAELDKNWPSLAPSILHYNFSVSDDNLVTVAEQIRGEYLPDASLPLSYNNSWGLVQLSSDRNFIVGIEQHARLQAAFSSAPVYLLRFDYRGSSSLHDSDLGGKNYGVGHADDLQYFFNETYSHLRTEDDLKMRCILLKTWASFISTSIPKMPGKPQGWPPVRRNSPEIVFLNIEGPKNIHVESAKHIGNNDFWEKLPIIENDKVVSSRKTCRSASQFDL